MRVANNPAGRLGEQIDAALYLNHPYGRPVIGWRHEIEKLNREDALAFYRRFYTPNNAIVVVAGDVTPTRSRPSPRRPTARSRGAPRSARGSGRRSRRRTRRAPSRWPIRASSSRASAATISCRRDTTAKPGESEALDVLAHVLGTGSNSRLYRTLVVDKGIALNAGACYPAPRSTTPSSASTASPKPGVTLAPGRGRASTP